MDPKHRDRIAFFRLSSGHFKRGMKLHHIRSGKQITLHNPMLFLARDRETAEDAYAGDIIGIPNHGNLRIGDALTDGEQLRFTGIPSFAPEILRSVHPADPMRAKHLGRALQQLAEEGVARIFKPRIGTDWIVGVLGALQFDVMADRIRSEYEVPVKFETTSLHTARWVEAEDPNILKKFIDANGGAIADDHDDMPVFLAQCLAFGQCHGRMARCSLPQNKRADAVKVFSLRRKTCKLDVFYPRLKRYSIGL